MKAADWNAEGITHSSRGHHERALLCFRRALAIDPNYEPALHNIGLSFHALGCDSEAVRCLDEAARCNPSSPSIWTNRGAVLEAVGREAEALESYEKALELDSGFAAALTNKALLEEARGDRTKAEGTWRKYVEAVSQDDSQQLWVKQVESRLANHLQDPPPSPSSAVGNGSSTDDESLQGLSAERRPWSKADAMDPGTLATVPVDNAAAATEVRVEDKTEDKSELEPDSDPVQSPPHRNLWKWAQPSTFGLVLLAFIVHASAGSAEYGPGYPAHPEDLSSVPGMPDQENRRLSMPPEEVTTIPAPLPVSEKPPLDTTSESPPEPVTTAERAPTATRTSPRAATRTTPQPNPARERPRPSTRMGLLSSAAEAYNQRDRDIATALLTEAADPTRWPIDRRWETTVQLLSHVHSVSRRDSLAEVWLRWALRLNPSLPFDSATFSVWPYRSARSFVNRTPNSRRVQTTWEWAPSGSSGGGNGSIRVESSNGVGPLRVSLPGYGAIASDENIRLPPGSYALSATARGYSPLQATAEVLPGVTTVLTFDLARAAATAQQPTATPTRTERPASDPTPPGVQTNPVIRESDPPPTDPEPAGVGVLQVLISPWAVVSVDGVRIGRRSQFVDTLDAGVPHLLRLEREGVVSDTVIELRAGETRRLNLRIPLRD